MKIVRFTACKHLDFSDIYTAKKKTVDLFGETKVFWDRPVIDETYPAEVQFCKLRGRLNKPESCLCESEKMCSDYADFKHNVKI